MKRCNRFKDMMVDSLYGELTGNDKKILDNHLKTCLSCTREYQEMATVLGVMERRVQPEMSEEFWDNFMPGLNKKLDEAEEKVPAKTGPGLFKLPFNINLNIKFDTRWLLYPAAAMLLLVSGIIIGRFLYSPSGQDFLNNPLSSVRKTGPDVSEHFDNLQPVLIDYSNYTQVQPAGGATPGTVAVDKGILKRLMLENQLLKKAAGRSNDPALKQLMEDLEMILLELNNAGSIEGVQEMLDRNDILFKMKVFRNRAKSRGGPIKL